MLTVRLFCEASAAELYDPAIRWNPNAYGYFRSARRCKNFEAKLLILAHFIDYIRDDSLSNILELLSEKHKFLFMKAVISTGRLHTEQGPYPGGLIYGKNINLIISAGLDLKYINWTLQIRNYPSDIWLYKDYIIHKYCGFKNKKSAEDYINSFCKVGISTSGGAENKYKLLILSNYVDKEFPIYGIEDWLFMQWFNHPSHHLRIVYISLRDMHDYYDKILGIIDEIYAYGWILDLFTFSNSEFVSHFQFYHLRNYLNKLIKNEQLYMFYERPDNWKLSLLNKLDERQRTYIDDSVGFSINLNFLRNDKACQEKIQLSAKYNPNKYALWRKYRERFIIKN